LISKEPKHLEKSCKFPVTLFFWLLRKSCFKRHCILKNKGNLHPRHTQRAD